MAVDKQNSSHDRSTSVKEVIHHRTLLPRALQTHSHHRLLQEQGSNTCIRESKNSRGIPFRRDLFSNVPLERENTAIFLDEIQLADNIDLMTLAKALQQDGRYRFIFSGSLLGVSEKNVLLIPGGSLYSEEMYPLDFEEFLWANGVQQESIDILRKCFVERTEAPPVLPSRMMDYFYLLVGGMPDALKTCLEKKDLPSLNISFKPIDELYQLEITKYAPVGERIYIKRVYELLPNELNSRSKRLILSNVRGRGTLKRAQNDFLWLSQAGTTMWMSREFRFFYPRTVSF